MTHCAICGFDHLTRNQRELRVAFPTPNKHFGWVHLTINEDLIMAQQSFEVNNSADLPITFMLASQDKKSTSYMAPTSSLMEPLRFTIDSDIKNPGSRGSSRITVAAALTKLESSGQPATARVSIQVVVPTGVAITSQNLGDLRAFVVNYFTTANFALIRDGIVP